MLNIIQVKAMTCMTPLNRVPAAQICVLTIIRIRVHNGDMIVCVCKAVSERHIRAAVIEGATRLQDLSRQTGLGTCCGKCLPEARSALARCLSGGGAQRSEARPGYFPAAAAV
jgi:bacterioferritin-associated ferredoxin